MEKITNQPKFRVKLLVDVKKHKVVLAETCRDFIDVLFSLLTLPMGTIIRRLLEKHSKSVSVKVGCFNNIYTSVSDMSIDDFETEACKNMLLYPRSTKEIHCRKLKLNIDDTEETKFFTCNRFPYWESCRQYNNFNTSRCSCGDFMTRENQVSEEDQVGGSILGNDKEDGVFVRCRSAYNVTDDLKVTLSSLGVVANVLTGLGYADFDDLKELFIDVGLEEVLILMGNIVSSEFPLSSTFLKQPFLAKLKDVSSTHTRRIPFGPKMGIPIKAEHVNGGGLECNVKLFVRKIDKKILYAECGEDFVDNLLSFLILPLESVWSFSNDHTILESVGNLCRSECRVSTSREIPYYYAFSNQLLDIPFQPPVEYKCLNTLSRSLKFVRQVTSSEVKTIDEIIHVTPIDPKLKSGSPSTNSGFVKKDTKFIVSDDLVITPMSSSSSIGLFMKSEIKQISDIEEHTISISKTELINILRASLISCSALTNGLSNLISKNPKKQVHRVFQINIQ